MKEEVVNLEDENEGCDIKGSDRLLGASCMPLQKLDGFLK